MKNLIQEGIQLDQVVREEHFMQHDFIQSSKERNITCKTCLHRTSTPVCPINPYVYLLLLCKPSPPILTPDISWVDVSLPYLPNFCSIFHLAPSVWRIDLTVDLRNHRTRNSILNLYRLHQTIFPSRGYDVSGWCFSASSGMQAVIFFIGLFLVGSKSHLILVLICISPGTFHMYMNMHSFSGKIATQIICLLKF